jgi:hypothetical protein
MERADIDPKSWGPVAWAFLDSVVLSYPIMAAYQDQLWITDFITSLSDALPCEKCRMNFKIYLGQHPIQQNVTSRDSLKTWLDSYKTWSSYRA